LKQTNNQSINKEIENAMAMPVPMPYRNDSRQRAGARANLAGIGLAWSGIPEFWEKLISTGDRYFLPPTQLGDNFISTSFGYWFEVQA
jgi:hypothetical protein